MACASGCSDSRSRLAARRSTSSPKTSVPITSIAVTLGRPSVSVPVLSNMTTSILRPRSSASPFLMRMPRRAPTPVPTMIAVGVANPSEQGHAISSTATAGTKLCATSPVARYQPSAVASAIARTTGTKMPETRSASFWIGALLPWASETMRTIWASTVSVPTLVARIVNAPERLIVAPNTSSPVALPIGMLSPVSMDSSTLDVPWMSAPSTGTFSPGRTRTVSPTATCSIGRSRSARSQ